MFLFSRAHLSERSLLILLATVQFTHIMDFMIMMPLGPQLMRELAMTPQAFSVLIAAYTMTSGVVGLLVAPFVDRFDRRRVLLAAYAGFIIGTLGCALSHTVGEFLVARAICGAFGGISATTVMAIAGDIVPAQRRGYAMGVIMTAFSAASALGIPFGLFLAQKMRWEAPFFLLVGLGLVAEGLMLVCLPHVRGHLAHGIPPSWKNFMILLRDRNAWRGLLLVMSLVFGHFTMIPFLSPHLILNLKLPEGDLALVYIVGGLLTVVTAPWIGRMSDRFGRVQVFSGVVCVAAVVIFAMVHVGPLPVWGTLILTGMFFVFASGRYVPAQAVLTSAIPASRRGAYMSLTSCTRDFFTGTASLMAGKIVVSAPDALLRVNWLGWFAMASSLLGIWLIRRVKPVKEAPPPPSEAAIAAEAMAEG